MVHIQVGHRECALMSGECEREIKTKQMNVKTKYKKWKRTEWMDKIHTKYRGAWSVEHHNIEDKKNRDREQANKRKWKEEKEVEAKKKEQLKMTWYSLIGWVRDGITGLFIACKSDAIHQIKLNII